MHVGHALDERRGLALLGVKDALGAAAHDVLALRVRRKGVIILSVRDGRRRRKGVVDFGLVGARAVRQLRELAPARVGRVELGEHVGQQVVEDATIGAAVGAPAKAALVEAEALARRKRKAQHVGRAVRLGVVGDDAAARGVRDDLAVGVVIRLGCAFTLLEVGRGRRRRRRRAWRRGHEGASRRRRRARRARRRRRRKRALGVVEVLDVRVQRGRARAQQKVEARVLRAPFARAFQKAIVLSVCVRLAHAAVPANLLAKGRDHAVARDGLVLAEALGNGHADLAVLHALEPALADGHDTWAHLLAHVDLERGALD